MKLKVKHKLKTIPHKPKLSEINELTLSVFIVKRKFEDKIKYRILELGGKILSIFRGIGISRQTVFESLKMGTDDVSVVLMTSRVEDVRDIMQIISEEFELSKPGNGKGFTIDVDGYLGAKAIFIED